MILVRLMGGLGNQMFQYATAYALALRNRTSVKIDTTLLEMNKKNPHEINTHREMDLEVFDIKLEHAGKKEIEYFNGRSYGHLFGKAYNALRNKWVSRHLIIERHRGFDHRLKGLGDDKCLVGGWQAPAYFDDRENEIRNLFRFKKPVLDISSGLLERIQKGNSICVNVRRGDYVTSPIYSRDLGAQPASYYLQGIEHIAKQIQDPQIFVFSDEIEWCNDNIKVNYPIEYVGHEHAGPRFSNYLLLMTHCKHFVIPNSTFGWWAAWLSSNTNKIVVAPKKWVLNPEVDPMDIMPTNWIRL